MEPLAANHIIQPTRTQRTHVDEKSTPYIRLVGEIMCAPEKKRREREIKLLKKNFSDNFTLLQVHYTIFAFSQKPLGSPLPTALCIPDLSLIYQEAVWIT